jgi:NitT/TauT family transport system permease protein
MSSVAAPARAPSRLHGRATGAAAAVGLPALAIVALLAAWWLVKLAFGWKTFILPSPWEVARELWRQRSYLPHELGVTLVETLEGYALAIAAGTLLAVVIAASRAVDRALTPVLVAVNAVPKVAIAPILVLWMGFGPGPKVVMVFLVCFFPIVIATAAGLQATPADLLELVRSLSASRTQVFVKVRFPAALPYVFVGLKTAISLAVIGAVIGEFVGASHGLGYVITASGASANTPVAFAAIVLLGALSLVLFYLLVLAERLLVPWARHER